MTSIKQENTQRVEDGKRVKEREIKKIKDEMDRIKKAGDDKLKKLDMEF
jgi:hypothetical protein